MSESVITRAAAEAAAGTLATTPARLRAKARAKAFEDAIYHLRCAQAGFRVAEHARGWAGTNGLLAEIEVPSADDLRGNKRVGGTTR